MERHAQVGKDAVDMPQTVIAQEILQVGEVAMYKCKPVVGKPVGPRVHVLVHTQQTAAGTQLRQDGTAVAATAEGHVYIGAIGLDGKPVNALVEQCRYVVNLLFHCYRVCLRASLF